MNRKVLLDNLMSVRGTVERHSEVLILFPDTEGGFCLSYKDKQNISRWKTSDYLCLDLLITSERMPTLYVDFVERLSQGEKVLSIRYLLVPSVRIKTVIRLDELDSHRYFLPTYPGSFKVHVEGEPTSLSNVDEIRIRMNTSKDVPCMELFGMWVSPDIPDMQVRGKTLVDAMGQRKIGHWPGKVESFEQLEKYLTDEVAHARENTSYPKGWSTYGGWMQNSFDATGFFHTHFDGSRWWLVDPEGYAFISNGVCYGARMGVHGFVDRMETLFDWLPKADERMWEACWTEASEIPEFVKRNGKEEGIGRKMFNFPRANMIKVFGPDLWWDAWVTLNSARLKNWGFNTIGVGVNTYTDERIEDFLKQAEIPFVITLKEFPRTKESIYRDFPDVFSDEYAKASSEFASSQLAPYVGNPYLIGYFLTNEPEWLFQRSVNPAERVLAHKGPLASKDALIAFLQERYTSIDDVNLAWKTAFSSFSELLQPIEHADTFSEQSCKDLAEFRDLLIKRYCEIPSSAARSVDPDHLNLGMRYNRLSEEELPGTESMDVCSFNCYRSDPRTMLTILEQQNTVPGMIGEWHIAAREMRNFASGLVSTVNQEERVKAFLYYAEQAVSHPYCVGLHYFEMNDQPLLGRFDGECMQHGLISVCNIPYQELSQAMGELASRLYPLASGVLKPTTIQGEIYGYHA